MTSRLLATCATGALAALLLGGSATAQTADAANDPGATATTAAASNGEDIVVTAQKREQALIDVPQSVSVVSGATLERQQATSFEDYLKLVPGLQLNQNTPGQGRLILRGLNTGGVASTTSVYVDETPFGSSTALVNGGVLAADFDTFDVARVEVLRGPQGTLYGASSLGGVLKFVTNAPSTSAFEGRARGTIETTKNGEISYAGNALLNVPLGDMLAVRASGYYRHEGGWIDSLGTTSTDLLGFDSTTRKAEDINGADIYGGRASLLFTPSSALSVRLTAIAQNIRADAPSTVDSDANTLKTLYGGPTQSSYLPVYNDVDYRLYNGLLTYDFGFATLTSSTSFARQNQSYHADATFNLSGLLQAAIGAPTNALYLNQRTNDRKFTQEVRLSGAAQDAFDWLLGGYYTFERGRIYQEYVDVDPTTLKPITYPFILAQVSLDTTYKEYAGFANGTVHLGPRFDIDLGGRYSRNDQVASQGAVGVLAGNVPINSDLRSSDDVFTFAVAPKLKFGRQASLYLRVAKGYRPGGPNVIPPNAPAGTPASFRPDTVTNYEAGFKGETSDRTFGLDLSVYRIEWKNVQLIAAINGFGVNINGSSARSEGAEATATIRPVPGFVTSITGAYTNARLREDTPALVGGKAGDRLPFTPKYSVNVNSDYEWDVGGNAKAFIGGSIRFLSDQTANYDATFQTANGRQRRVPSYEVVDLRAGVDFGRFSVEAFARNLTDADGKTSVDSLTANGLPLLPNGAIGTGAIRPRTIGLTVGAGF